MKLYSRPYLSTGHYYNPNRRVWGLEFLPHLRHWLASEYRLFLGRHTFCLRVVWPERSRP